MKFEVLDLSFEIGSGIQDVAAACGYCSETAANAPEIQGGKIRYR